MVWNFGYRVIIIKGFFLYLEKVKIILNNSWGSGNTFFILKIIFGYTNALAYIIWK